jgi:hypothetical protein
MLGLIAAAVGAARGIAGAVGAKKEGNRRRQLLYEAYDRGKARLDVRQQDVRQGSAEGLVARGLGSGGGVTVGGPVGTGENLTVGGTGAGAAHTLGEQQGADLHREQGLEQNELLAQRNASIDDVTAGQRESTIGSIANGIQTGFNVYNAGQELGAMRSAQPTPPIAAPSVTPMTPPPAGAGTIRGAFGLDPITARPQPTAPGVNHTIGVGQNNYDFMRQTRERSALGGP